MAPRTDADAAGRLGWAVSVDSTINRAHQHTTSLPQFPGDVSNEKNLRTELPGIGRSGGGLSSKIHQLVDGSCSG